MKKIMVATDFSERSDRALRRATLLARQFDAGIVLVHVVDDDQPRRLVDTERTEAGKLLGRMASTLRDVDHVPCETRVLLASPFAGIAEAAREIEPDILVIGPHRRHILRDVFVGTTAERIMRSVDCPVLMANATPAGPYGHVLQTTDMSEGSRDALQRFAALGIGEQVHNAIVHVFDAPALRLVRIGTMAREERDHYLEEQRLDAARRLAAFLASSGVQGVATMLRHEEAPAAFEILKAAQEIDADLLVLATRGRRGIARLVIGSVTEQVLRTSPIDVLAIPPSREE